MNLTKKWNDTANLLSKLTAARIANCARVMSSYYRSRSSKVLHHTGMPISLSFEPTTSCNLRCPECPSGLRSFTRPTGMLSGNLYENVIDELAPTLLYLILYFQGEPYLNANFFDFISFAADRKIYTATSTNGHYLDPENSRKTVESGLDRIIISIDGADQSTYESYRIGGSLEKVIEGTRQLVKWKRKLKSTTPHIILQFIVFRQNETQIDQIRKLGKQLEVDEVAIKTAQIYDYMDGSERITSVEKYSRYTQNGNGKWKLKNELFDHCWKMWQSSVITWDGKVVPCCFDKDASHVLGDASMDSFEKIWKSDPYNNFRKQILKSRSSIDICTNCTEGTKVWS